MAKQAPSYDKEAMFRKIMPLSSPPETAAPVEEQPPVVQEEAVAVPVSYTHLDVYKRQITKSFIYFPLNGFSQFIVRNITFNTVQTNSTGKAVK